MCKLITVDIGSFNIKTSGKGVIGQNRFYKDNSIETFGLDYVKIDNDTYIAGGDFDKEFIKCKKNIQVPLFYALAKSDIGESSEINLILHLPASQISNKNFLVDMLQNKTFEYIVNGKEYKTTFKKVGVLKEGWTSFYSLKKRNEGLIGIIDIGGRTTDCFSFEDGKLRNEKSINIGMLNIFNDIADRLIANGENRNIEEIHTLLTNDIISIDDYKDILEKYSNKIINDLKLSIPNIKDFKIHLTGGGAVYLIDIFKVNGFKVELMNNTLNSNCEGSYNIGKAKGL